MTAGPTQRTLEVLRRFDIAAQVVEKWNPHARRRVDLFGFIDVLAIDEFGCVGIQATSGSNGASRVTKIQELGDLPVRWLRAGNGVQVWAWRKLKRNGRAVWLPRISTLRLADGAVVVAAVSELEELAGPLVPP